MGEVEYLEKEAYASADRVNRAFRALTHAAILFQEAVMDHAIIVGELVQASGKEKENRECKDV